METEEEEGFYQLVCQDKTYTVHQEVKLIGRPHANQPPPREYIGITQQKSISRKQ